MKKIPLTIVSLVIIASALASNLLSTTQPEYSQDQIPNYLESKLHDPELSEENIKVSIDSVYSYLFYDWREKEGIHPQRSLTDLFILLSDLEGGMPISIGRSAFTNSPDQLTALILYSFLKDHPEEILPVFMSYRQLLYNRFPVEQFEGSEFSYLLSYLQTAYFDIYGDNDAERLKSIYNVMSTVKHYYVHEYYNDILPFIDKTTLNDFNTNKQEISKEGLVWAYSFWARRHAERTDDAFFKIMEDIIQYYSRAYLYSELDGEDN